MTIADFPVHVYTGHLTADQLDGEACAECGGPFRRGQSWVYLMPGLPDARLARHTACRKGDTR